MINVIKILLFFGFFLNLAYPTVHLKKSFEYKKDLEVFFDFPNGFNKADTYFSNTFLQFPKYGELKEYHSTYILSAFNYSSMFCSRRFVRDKRKSPDQRSLYGELPIEQDIQDWSDDQRRNLFSELANFFWFRPIQMDEESIFMDLVYDLIEAETDSDVIQKVLCTYFASSFEFRIKR